MSVLQQMNLPPHVLQHMNKMLALIPALECCEAELKMLVSPTNLKTLTSKHTLRCWVRETITFVIFMVNRRHLSCSMSAMASFHTRNVAASPFPSMLFERMESGAQCVLRDALLWPELFLLIFSIILIFNGVQEFRCNALKKPQHAILSYFVSYIEEIHAWKGEPLSPPPPQFAWRQKLH